MTDGIYLSPKNKEQPVLKESYDIDGNITSKLTETVCKITISQEIPSFYIRIIANEPVKKERFDRNNHVLTPSFAMVDKVSFDHYIMYLSSGQESFWLATKNQMKLKGYI